MVNEGAHTLERDAVGWRLKQIIRIVHVQEAEPAPIGGTNHPARALREMSPGAARLVEDVSRLIGCPKGFVVGLWPLVQREMLQRSHGGSSVFFLGLRLRCGLRLSFSASRCLKRKLL